MSAAWRAASSRAILGENTGEEVATITAEALGLPGIVDDGERVIPEFHHDAIVYAEHISRYLFASRFVSGKSILDVASGVGYGSDILRAEGAAEVIGLDRSSDALFYGQTHYSGSGADFVLGDGGSLPFLDGRFDVVVSFETIEHVPDHRAFLAEVQRVLKPLGLFIVSTPNKQVYPEGNPFHLKEFYFKEFEDALNECFKNVSVMPQDSWLTNAILPANISEQCDGSVEGPLNAFKLTGRAAEGALYMVAVCSDAPLPQAPAHLIMASVSDSEYVAREMTRRDMEIERANMLLAEKVGALATQEVARKRQDDLLGARDEALRRLAAELEGIRLSAGYRLLERYRRMIRWLFPAGSWRSLPYQMAMSLIQLVTGHQHGHYSVSRRQRIWKLARRSVEIIRHEGWRSYLGKLKRRLTARTYGSQHLQPEMVEEMRPLTFPKQDQPVVSIVIPVFNKSLYTFNCLLAVLRNSEDPPFEVIVVDDGSSDNTQRMLAQIENIRVETNSENLGFVNTCNNGAKVARGKYLVFLNNDTQVAKGWLSALVEVVERDQSAGLVGAKLLFPNGKLQEAGGIVWRDASAWNYGRSDDPGKPEYNYVREVDYCSAACVLVRRDLFEQIGGFDLRYAPAYYEDTDLAFEVRKRGYKVLYQPKAVVNHFEGATAGTDTSTGVKRYQAVNMHKFRDKWRDVLDSEHLPNGQAVILVRDRRKAARAVVIDHFVPSFDRDAGSLRMYQILKLLTNLGLVVTFVPDNMARSEPYTQTLQQLGIEVLYGPKDVSAHLRDLGPYLQLGIVSRPDVAAMYAPMVRKCAPNATLIYDTVDLHFLREERRAEVERSESAQKSAQRYRQLELALANSYDATIVVTEAEKRLLLDLLPGLNVHVIPTIHEIHASATPLAERRGMLFVGSFLHPPNVDAAVYLVTSILPLIRKEIEDVTLYLVGADPPPEVRALASERVIVTGWVEDLSTYLETARIFVAPLRYGAGLKGKISQSMSYGLPVVTTTVGAEGMDIEDGREALVADDPQDFAGKVIGAYQDDELWTQLAEYAVRFAEANYSTEVVSARLMEVLRMHGVETAVGEGVAHHQPSLARA